MCWECTERGSSFSLTPTPTPSPSPSDYVRQQSPQSTSSFFTKFNHNIRQKIYHELFGFLRVHVRYHERNDQSKHKHGWSYVLCQEEHSPKGCALHPDSFVRNYNSCSHTSEPLESNLLYTCQQAYSEGRIALYGSATFVSRSPIDCIQFTKDIPRRSWPQNLEFNCNFRPELEYNVPLLDLLYWVVDDFRASKVKIWLANSYYQTDKVSFQAQQNTIEALKHFLSYSKSDTTFILPLSFKPSVKNLTFRSPGKFTFKFLEHHTSDDEIELAGLAYRDRSYEDGYPGDSDDEISD